MYFSVSSCMSSNKSPHKVVSRQQRQQRQGGNRVI